MDRIALLDGVKPLHDLVIKKGYNVVLLTRKENLKADDAERGYEAIFSLPSTATEEEWHQLIHSVNTYRPISKIISFHDDDQLRAVKLANSLELSSYLSAEAVMAAKDKSIMRKLLNKRGIDNTKWKIISNQSDLANLANDVPFPFIIKPIDGVASRDIYRVDHKDTLDELALLLDWNKDNKYLAEEYHNGQEYSIEGFSVNGSHYFIGATQKYLFENSYVERGHVFPARIENSQFQKITTTISLMLDALGIKEGPSHTEIKITTDNEIKIIETHTRLGGDRISELIKVTHDLDLFELTVDHALGLHETVKEKLNFAINQKSYKYAAICFGSSAAFGTVVKANGLDEVNKNPNVVKAEFLKSTGTSLQPLKSSFDRSAICIAMADSPEKAWEIASSEIQNLTFEIIN